MTCDCDKSPAPVIGIKDADPQFAGSSGQVSSFDGGNPFCLRQSSTAHYTPVPLFHRYYSGIPRRGARLMPSAIALMTPLIAKSPAFPLDATTRRITRRKSRLPQGDVDSISTPLAGVRQAIAQLNATAAAGQRGIATASQCFDEHGETDATLAGDRRRRVSTTLMRRCGTL